MKTSSRLRVKGCHESNAAAACGGVGILQTSKLMKYRSSIWLTARP